VALPKTSNGVKLSIYSLKKVLFSGEADSLNCKTMIGEITVLNNHQALISVLAKGVMKVVESRPQSNTSPSDKFEGASHFFEIKSGFLEVRKNNEVICIVD